MNKLKPQLSKQERLKAVINNSEKELQFLQRELARESQKKEKIKPLQQFHDCIQIKANQWRHIRLCLNREVSDIHSIKALKKQQYYTNFALGIKEKIGRIYMKDYTIRREIDKLIGQITMSKIEYNALQVMSLRFDLVEKQNRILNSQNKKWWYDDRDIEKTFAEISATQKQLELSIDQVKQKADLWEQRFQNYIQGSYKNRASKYLDEKQFYEEMLLNLQRQWNKSSILTQALEQETINYRIAKLENQDIEINVRIDENKNLQTSLENFNLRKSIFKEKVLKIDKILKNTKKSDRVSSESGVSTPSHLKKLRESFLIGFYFRKSLHQYYEEAKESAEEKLASFKECKQYGDEFQIMQAKLEVEFYLDIAQNWKDISNQLTRFLRAVRDDIRIQQRKLAIERAEANRQKK